jgi:hypothetical protein
MKKKKINEKEQKRKDYRLVSFKSKKNKKIRFTYYGKF